MVLNTCRNITEFWPDGIIFYILYVLTLPTKFSNLPSLGFFRNAKKANNDPSATGGRIPQDENP